ncbi:MAG: hypothetical protein QXE12_04020 [Conexivisphaerales archaeon]
MTIDQINNLIQKKKTSIGSGYLTDAGAAYLVANDLGLALSEIKTKIYNLNEIVGGLSSISIQCHFLSLSEPRTFVKKDGSISEYSIMLVFDNKIISRVLWWDISKIKEKTFDIGKTILLENVNTKLDRYGKPEIHTTVSTRIIEQDLPKKDLNTIIKKISEVNSQESNLVIKGTIHSEIKRIEFIGKDNSPKKALSFFLSEDDNPSYNIRVIIWSPNEKQENSLLQGTEILLIDVKSKIGVKGNYELHGDKNTRIITLKREEPSMNYNHFTILSMGAPSSSDQARTMLLTNGNTVVMFKVSGEIRSLLETVNIGDVIGIDNYYIEKGYLFANNTKDNFKMVGSNESILSSFTTNIRELPKKSTPVIIELVALSKTIKKTIRTRNGRSVTRAELLVGDETGETLLFGWESYGKQLEGILPGTRLVIYGALPVRQPDGSYALQCKEFTEIKLIYG